jgi:hypothetical protein
MRIRTEIRTATAGLLAGATDAGSRVFRRRMAPIPAPEPPFLLVYAAGEAASGDEGMSAPHFQHDLTLTIEATVNGTDEAAEDALDALCGQVLDRLLTDPSWVRSWSRIVAVNTSSVPAADDDRLVAKVDIVGRFHTVWEPVLGDELASVGLKVDAIDPADPNAAPEGGPDGRIEIGGGVVLPPFG